ncbi:MAG TPA: extracellular solute-binding protein, partial [Myxococcota bacterium]|nr:extracellular solute-binding protein [Myxococcota bacterium]
MGAAGGGLATLLAACGAPQSGSTGGAGGSGAPEKIVWSTFRGGADGGKWRQMQIDRYQAKFPRTKVDLQVLTQDYPKQFALAAAGSLGDVYAWDPSHWVFYDAINRRVIRPVDEYIKRDKFDLGQFYKPFNEYQRWDGKTWGLPSWGWTGHDGLLYNTELAQQAGVTFPDPKSAQWTMPALYDIVVRLNRLVSPAGGFALSTTLPGAIAVTIFCRAGNGDNLSPDGKKSLLLDAKNKEAMRWVYDLAHKEKAVATPGRYEGNVGDLFMNGKVAMEQAGSLSVFTRNKANTNGQLKFKSALFPKRQDGKRPSQLRGGTWNVGVESAGTRSPDAAWELIKLITDREGALTLNTIGGEGALVRPDIMTDTYFADPNFKVYLENFENAMVHIVPSNFRGQEF